MENPVKLGIDIMEYIVCKDLENGKMSTEWTKAGKIFNSIYEKKFEDKESVKVFGLFCAHAIAQLGLFTQEGIEFLDAKTKKRSVPFQSDFFF